MWEWVADWYAEQYPAGNATDPQGPPSGTKRGLRGGSWLSPAWYSRASFRIRFGPVNGLNDIGFRCAGNKSPFPLFAFRLFGRRSRRGKFFELSFTSAVTLLRIGAVQGPG